MKEPVLVIMAAGMGSRYGGLKQIDPIDTQGNLIIDFSIYDAIQAGFKKLIFIIKKEIEEDFKEIIGNRISNYIEVDYVYQEINKVPEGSKIPKDRKKPWGTGHAVLCCKKKIDGPFAVINADDYYGREAFEKIYNRLTVIEDDEKYQYVMVGYILENTLTKHGHVARGVCEISENGKLITINERTRIEKRESMSAYTEDDGKTWIEIPEASTVSMNMWGFTYSILEELEHRFGNFLNGEVIKNPLKSEYFLPSVVGELLSEKKAVVDVLTSKDRWYGVTYRKDKEMVEHAVIDLKSKGIYPEILWK